MSVRDDDDDLPDQIEYDPRWEVQPQPDDDDPGSNARAALFAALVLVVLVALLAWMVVNAEPAF